MTRRRLLADIAAVFALPRLRVPGYPAGRAGSSLNSYPDFEHAKRSGPASESMRKKLREVQYFLRQMNTIARREVGDPEEFEFLLSAFLSACISITDPLDSRPYRAWFDAWRRARTGREQELLEFVRVQRNLEVHRDGAEVDLAVQYIPITELRTGARGHPAYGFHWFGPPGTPPPAVGVNLHHFEFGGTKVEAHDTCGEVTQLLDELVNAFETAYPIA